MLIGRVLRVAAGTTLVAGVAAPLLRRKLKLHPAVTLATASAAPFALTVLAPRTRLRDAGVVALQMWAYFAAYEMPADDMEKLIDRVHVDYPVNIDKVVGLGRIPSIRLQQALHEEGTYKPWEKALAVSHGVWFAVPHAATAYVLLRHRERFAELVPKIYATFDLGALIYWLLPTAPPWYAAEHGRIDPQGGEPLQRLLLGYGEQVLGRNWDLVYGALAGNPVAAMPSLHFGTSVAAAEMLRDIGPVQGAIGWAYASSLGFALVYLGEHYVVDLAAGAGLAFFSRKLVKEAAPLAGKVSRLMSGLGRIARA